MKVGGRAYRSIWLAEDARDGVGAVEIIDQTRLPHGFVTRRLETLDEAATAIRDMWVRGAPLIGATAAYGLALALRADSSDANLERAAEVLIATRPTAVNLRWAVDDLLARLRPAGVATRAELAYARAAEICDDDVAINRAIGGHGLGLRSTC
jgi:methylthioribose-1-phosphate isomerase